MLIVSLFGHGMGGGVCVCAHSTSNIDSLSLSAMVYQSESRVFTGTAFRGPAITKIVRPFGTKSET